MNVKTIVAAIALTVAAGAATAETIYVPGTPTSGAVVASSGSANGGSRMLAKIARVAPGQYTNNEMLRIDAARRAGETDALNLYLTHGNRSTAADASAVVPGEAQIAARLGLDPTEYTMVELVRIEAMQSNTN